MKFPKRMSFFLITSALALGVGLTLSINNKIDVNAAETLTYSTGFEASEGFSVSTVYNNSEPRLQGPSGQQWGTIMSTATTTAPLAGSQQIQLRSYADNTTVGRAYPDFYFVNLTKVTFYTRAYISGSTMSVEYSLDNSTWAAMTITGTYSTTPPQLSKRQCLLGSQEISQPFISELITPLLMSPIACTSTLFKFMLSPHLAL